jgi:hypothetical protein
LLPLHSGFSFPQPILADMTCRFEPLQKNTATANSASVQPLFLKHIGAAGQVVCTGFVRDSCCIGSGRNQSQRRDYKNSRSRSFRLNFPKVHFFSQSFEVFIVF